MLTTFQIIICRIGSIFKSQVIVCFCNVGFLGLQVTVFGFARERITCTNTQSKRQSSNLAKLLIRSTSPVLLQNRCYSQWFLSDASANHCQYYSFPPLSCRLVWLRIFYFQKGRKFFLFNFVSVGKVKALLQALVWAWTCAACKCAFIRAWLTYKSLSL